MHKVFVSLIVLLLLMLPACVSPTDEVSETSLVPSTPTQVLEPTQEPTATAEPTATEASDPSLTPEPTVAQEPTLTPTSESTPTEVPDPTATQELTSTEVPVPTATQDPDPTNTPEPTPTEQQETEPTATPDPDLTAVPSPGTTPEGIAIRPDLAGTIAFVIDNNIHAYAPQTGEVTQLIENGRDMQFSPDGSQIAFVRDDGLYLAAADGSNVRQIVAQTGLSQPRWTDDASKLAFERQLDQTEAAPGAGEIWVVELPDGEPVKIADGSDPAWAPDGLRVAFVTEITDDLRRNELRLVNWQGENEWTVVSELPDGTPPIGGLEPVPPENLEHRMFDPVWSGDGDVIFVPSFVLYQALVGYSIWERADAYNGGSEFLTELPEIGEAVSSPDRQAVVLTTPTARGDTGLLAIAIGTDVSDEDYSWAETDEIANHLAPTWSPASNALVAFRCTIEQEPGVCDLVLFQPEQDQDVVLIPDALAIEDLAQQSGFALAWGQVSINE